MGASSAHGVLRFGQMGASSARGVLRFGQMGASSARGACCALIERELVSKMHVAPP